MNTTLKMASCFLLGIAVGGVSGYFIQKKKLQVHYANIASNEIEDVKEHYRLVRKEGYSSPEVESNDETPASNRRSTFIEKEQYDEVVNSLGYTVEEMNERLENRNIFSDDDESDEEDGGSGYLSELEEMIENRNPDEPYVISVGEFQENDTYEPVVVVYYDGDGVLTDEFNKVVPDVDRLIGSGTLSMFGRFSEDKNIVYVRNERLELKFEVIRDDRSYAESIMGIKDNKNTIQKMKEDIE